MGYLLHLGSALLGVSDGDLKEPEHEVHDNAVLLEDGDGEAEESTEDSDQIHPSLELFALPALLNLYEELQDIHPAEHGGDPSEVVSVIGIPFFRESESDQSESYGSLLPFAIPNQLVYRCEESACEDPSCEVLFVSLVMNHLLRPLEIREVSEFVLEKLIEDWRLFFGSELFACEVENRSLVFFIILDNVFDVYGEIYKDWRAILLLVLVGDF